MKNACFHVLNMRSKLYSLIEKIHREKQLRHISAVSNLYKTQDNPPIYSSPVPTVY